MAGVGFETIHAVAPPPISRTPTPRKSASLQIPSPPGGSADGGCGRSKKVRGWSSSGCLSRCGARLGSRGLTIPRIRVPRVRASLEKEEEEEQRASRLIRTLLIDNYDSYTYNIYQELTVVNGQPPIVVYNDEWTWDYARQCLHEAAAFDNIVISPGPGSPKCSKDIGICLKILLECKDIPILAVCLGHQALGYVHGARITHAPEPIHGRLSEIEHTGCDLFLDIPSGSESGFKVVRYHSLIIDEDSLPKELIPIAWATHGHAHSLFQTKESDTMPIFLSNKRTLALCADYFSQSVDTLSNKLSMEKILMGIRHSARPHYGVQFHPESVATSYGRQIFENFKKITIDHGLRSSALPYTKMALGYQLPKGQKRSKLLANNLDMGQQTVTNRISKSKDMKHLKLQWRKLDGMARQVGGSRNIFSELFGDQNAEDTFWLDSSSTEQVLQLVPPGNMPLISNSQMTPCSSPHRSWRRARFSFMGGKGGPLWKQITFWLSDQSNITAGGGYLSTRDITGKKKIKFLNDGFLNFMDMELKSFHYDKEDYEALPFNFCGGFVGFLGYGLKVECGASSNSHKSGTPDACFFFADNLLVIDHNNDDVYILCIQDACCPIFEAAQCNASRTWIDETEKKLLGLISTRVKMSDQRKSSTSLFNLRASNFIVAKTRYQYMKDVESCQKLIRDGESYELCLTTQMRKKVKDIHAIKVYYSLRESNPAPYAAWLNFSSENLCILCSSPERFLQLDRNGILEAKPIKGTITRGATLEEDSHFKFQLQNSEKDQAENLMIVDLLRNDLGRVCEPGTVHVPDLMKVESYATVHTMVSTIQGKKMSDLSPMDCVRAAFPGGSMTGAPKLRSMEILDKLECCSRGIYSGSIGFFSYNQRFDLNIVIRTVVIHEGEASIGAGGAVVALSNPSEEYEEMMLKARAPASAVEYSEGGSESKLTSSSSHCGTYG